MCGPISPGALAGSGAATACASSEGGALEVRVLGALSGGQFCTVLADPRWTVWRLKTQIASLDGSPVRSQHLMVDNVVLGDEQIVADVVKGEASLAVWMVRAKVPCPAPICPGGESLHIEPEAGSTRVIWTVSTRRLRSKDKQAVSQPFELDFGGRFQHVTFRMSIFPQSDLSFRQTSGRGHAKLKCEPYLPEAVGRITFKLWAGQGERLQGPLGPYAHDFSVNSLCGAPRGLEELDFSLAVDEGAESFDVCFEIAQTDASKAATQFS